MFEIAIFSGKKQFQIIYKGTYAKKECLLPGIAQIKSYDFRILIFNTLCWEGKSSISKVLPANIVTNPVMMPTKSYSGGVQPHGSPEQTPICAENFGKIPKGDGERAKPSYTATNCPFLTL